MHTGKLDLIRTYDRNKDNRVFLNTEYIFILMFSSNQK